MKTYYDLLSLDPSSDVETIKKAFRREIAKYHPDKVTHLGAEFQEMASTRAAELTAAYKTLTDPEARAEYDASLGDAVPGRPVAPPPVPSEADGAATRAAQTAETEAQRERHAPGRSRFEEDRAGKDDIVRRATIYRVRDALQHVVGDCDLPSIKGFDLACVPRSKPVTSMTFSQLFKKEVVPAVLVRLVPIVDAAVASEAFQQAVRARLDTKKQPLALLLIGNHLAPAGELARAIEEARKKSPASQDTIFPVPIDLRDWSAKVPLNAPEAIRSLIKRLKSSV